MSKPMRGTFSLGQAAQQSGFSIDTLRYYEKIGLIAIERRANGHREFNDDDVEWLGVLRCLRETGVPIADMRRYAELARCGDGTMKKRLRLLSEHDRHVAETAATLQAQRKHLANRGYLCVQVNYRGSRGYGKAFVNAADREWGGKMHDDLLDAVTHVTGQGWADPARVAIYGGSYGGYAALAGAAFSPGVFCCAIDICGPSNLKTLIESLPPYLTPEAARFHRRVGDPEKDAEFLWSRSPLSRVSDIRIPLLIAQGANDPRVKQAESEQIVAALEQAGIEHEYLLFPDEGHGFAKPDNRLRFFATAERFLARHLGGHAEEEEPSPAG